MESTHLRPKPPCEVSLHNHAVVPDKSGGDGWVGGPVQRDNETIRFSGDVREDSGPGATIEISGGSFAPVFASLSVGTFLVRQH
jgi:hypothetical protein